MRNRARNKKGRFKGPRAKKGRFKGPRAKKECAVTKIRKNALIRVVR
jgi:hypothetical protein